MLVTFISDRKNTGSGFIASYTTDLLSSTVATTTVQQSIPTGNLEDYYLIKEDIKIPTYKPPTNHKRSSVRSHTLAPTSIIM